MQTDNFMKSETDNSVTASLRWIAWKHPSLLEIFGQQFFRWKVRIFERWLKGVLSYRPILHHWFYIRIVNWIDQILGTLSFCNEIKMLSQLSPFLKCNEKVESNNTDNFLIHIWETKNLEAQPPCNIFYQSGKKLIDRTWNKRPSQSY